MNVVRILPMNHDGVEDFVGKTIEEVQKEFFCKTMIEEKGWYRYQTSGLDAKDGDLVLFQMDSQIIASALFKQRLPINDEEWKGALLFHCHSIRIFKPITKEELPSYIQDFKRFGDTKYSFTLDDEMYNRLLKRINAGL